MTIHAHRRVGQRVFTASCSADVEPQARWLLKQIARLHDQGAALLDGTKIRLGGAVLTVRAAPDGAALWESAFDKTDDALEIPDVTRSLRLTAEQLALVRAVGAHPEPTPLTETVRVAPGALKSRSIRMERTSLRSTGESGWSVLRDDRAPTGRWRRIRSAVFVDDRPGVLRVMMLPANYCVRLTDDAITSVLDPNDREVWAV